MSIKSQRVKNIMFGTGPLFEAYMAGRHLQSRTTNISRARIESSMALRQFWVSDARKEHHKFLQCVAKIKQLEVAP